MVLPGVDGINELADEGILACQFDAARIDLLRAFYMNESGTFLMLFNFAEVHPMICIELALLEVAPIGAFTLLNVRSQLVLG